MEVQGYHPQFPINEITLNRSTLSRRTKKYTCVSTSPMKRTRGFWLRQQKTPRAPFIGMALADWDGFSRYDIPIDKFVIISNCVRPVNVTEATFLANTFVKHDLSGVATSFNIDDISVLLMYIHIFISHRIIYVRLLAVKEYFRILARLFL